MHVASRAARSALLARRTTPLPPPPPILFSRGLAKKAAQKKGKEEEVKMHVDEKLEGIVRGLNIFKEQSEEVKQLLQLMGLGVRFHYQMPLAVPIGKVQHMIRRLEFFMCLHEHN